MRRLIVIPLVAAVLVALVLSSRGGDDSGIRKYTIELDNAFGLVIGGDVRIAGVNAGRISFIRLDKKSLKALVGVEITERGFGSIRNDVFCESRPQSPIGEYFLDCLPGTARKEIKPGERIPYEKTASTIPPDLITNIMRLPYRERLRLIVNEFGAGLAGRPEDLNEAIRRGVPALRQTARLLEVLAEHRIVIRNLVTNADRVLKRLADNRRNVGKFVVEARDTASAAAERDQDISTNFRKLPRFLSELRPTMAALGEVADEQRPVLVDLNASARNLRRFFDDTADFSRASRPAIRALGRAAPVGRQAVRAARPQIRQLRRYARPTPDLAENLAITLEDANDPRRTVEQDPRSPGGRGFTALEAIPWYAFNQALTNNAFDEVGHMVRVAPHTDQCSPYGDAETARRLPECRSWLGPDQPGVTTPDVSDSFADRDRDGGQRERRRSESRDRDRGQDGDRSDDRPGDGGGSGGGGGEQRGSPEAINELLEQLLGDQPRLPDPAKPPQLPQGDNGLLDYLLAP